MVRVFLILSFLTLPAPAAAGWAKKSMDIDDQDIHALVKEAWIKHNLDML
jgi:hypothetical protein